MFLLAWAKAGLTWVAILFLRAFTLSVGLLTKAIVWITPPVHHVRAVVESWVFEWTDWMPEPKPTFAKLLVGILGVGVLLGHLSGDMWNFAWTLWGTWGVGIAVWIVLERESEGFQRRVWLRKNHLYLISPLYGLAASSAHTAAIVLDLPKEVFDSLWQAESRRAQHSAQLHAMKRVVEIPANLESLDHILERVFSSLDKLEYANSLINQEATDSGQMFSRLTEIQGAIYRYNAEFRRFHPDLVRLQKRVGYFTQEERQLLRHALMSMAGASLSLCGLCADVRYEAGLLSD